MKEQERNSLVLLSSRQNLPTLEKTKDGISRIIKLGRLNEADGTALLKSLGVTKGLAKEFPKAVQEMDGHPLALVLLGKLLVKEHQGDIARRDQIKDLFSSVTDQGNHARQVMAYYDTIIVQANAPERVFLQLLGLFDRPMPTKAFEALKEKADLAKLLKKLSLFDFNRMIFNLEEADLLERSTNERTQWGTYPLVREYFGKHLETNQPLQFRQAHRVLFEFFQTVPQKRQPDTLEELEPLYRAVYHGCKAGEYKKAIDDVLHDRIHRGEENFSLQKLGAFGIELAAYAGFFHKGWETPVSEGLSESDQAWLLGQASYCLMSLGRMAEAEAPQQAAIRLWEKLKAWDKSVAIYKNRVDFLIFKGDLSGAMQNCKHFNFLAGMNENLFHQKLEYACLAQVWFRLGDIQNSKKKFRSLHNMRKELGMGLYDIEFCALLLAQARNLEALRDVLYQGKHMLEIAIVKQWLLKIALTHMIFGRSLAALGHFGEAKMHMDEAVTAIRKSGNVLYTPDILLHRASFLREQNEPDQAQFDLDEALEISEWSGMLLYEAEARLLEVHLRLDENNSDAAKKSLERAENLIHGIIKYPLRYAELSMAWSRFYYKTGDSVQAWECLKRAQERIEKTGHWGLIPMHDQIKNDVKNIFIEEKLTIGSFIVGQAIPAYSRLVPLRIAFFMVLLGHAKPEFLETLDPVQFRKFLDTAKIPGDSIEILDALQSAHPHISPNPLWLSWAGVVHKDKVERLQEVLKG
ncbi:MAG: hypothetical protein H7839_04440 [Magnetococcus sp. YQC-5]